MTKTFCDRCGKEGRVVVLRLSTPEFTERAIDACEQCIRDIKAQFGPQIALMAAKQRGEVA